MMGYIPVATDWLSEPTFTPVQPKRMRVVAVVNHNGCLRLCIDCCGLWPEKVQHSTPTHIVERKNCPNHTAGNFTPLTTP
jgi:hypothetical protein